MKNLFQRIFGRGNGDLQPENKELADALASMKDEDFSWMFPPATLVDPHPWDQFWRDQISHGVAGFVHIFCDDGELVDAMRENGLRTVLCVGNGISMEPHALARTGFDVTVLDLSPFAIDVARDAAPSEEFLAGLVGGRPAAPNGHIEFVVGDLRDQKCCPGPFDVIIDRKTLQLFREKEFHDAMNVVSNRLASPGIFFSHCHDGGWRPPAPRRHATQLWFDAEGWKIWRGGTRLTGRVAWLFNTTG